MSDQPAYRVSQVWEGLYEQLRTPTEMTNLPKALRASLDEWLHPTLDLVTRTVSDSGDTEKSLWAINHDAGRDLTIETVLMHYAHRTTVCVSTQAGCAMACGFCATGQAGFDRHLSDAEIVEQVIEAARRAPRRVSNVVFMGMGEPMANYDATWAAIRRIHGDLGVGARNLTLSTVGIIPGIERMAGEDLPVNLAVSLHAADDDLRDELVPVNRRYPLADLAAACRRYLDAKHRRLSFEWAMIDGVNDSSAHARDLAAYARPLRAHVNLIPLNRTPGYPVTGSPPDHVAAFRSELESLGINATIRQNRGTDIDAACGQLRATHGVHIRSREV